MARFGAAPSKDATSVKTVGLLTTVGGTRRAKLFDISMGSVATPGDNAFKWQVQRATTTGTATALTPNSLDPADTLASTITVNNVVTVEPTLTANAFLYQVALNQRASFRWVAAPYGELVIPATANAGLAIIASAATTTVLDAGVQYEEQ